MGEPDEIVCSTEEAFREACRKYGAFRNEFSMDPRGEVAYGRVRIVYRPPAPKPVSMEDAERKAFEEWGWKSGYDPTNSTLCFEAWKGGRSYRPAPARDEAVDAFEAWWSEGTARLVQTMPKSSMFAAFLAGRASVKP